MLPLGPWCRPRRVCSVRPLVLLLSQRLNVGKINTRRTSAVDEAGPVPADRSIWFDGEWEEQPLPRGVEEFPAVAAAGSVVKKLTAGEV